MCRLEIIANNTVEEDIRQVLNDIEDGFYYTRLNNVHGRGDSDPRMGDAVWPEENFIYIIYTDDVTAGKMVEAVREVKKRFTIEGIRVFRIPYEDLSV